MARKDHDKTKLAYAFLKANAGRPITIDQMTSVTAWERVTVQTYFSRQWKYLLSRGNSRKQFVVKRPFDLSFKDFQAIHSQAPVKPSGVLTGCVAFLDILGFREKIAGDRFDSLFTAYSSALASAISDEGTLGYAAFSDSIVIHTFDDSEAALFAIISAVSHLMNDFLKLQLPIRGCVSFGQFRRAGAGSNVIIAGRPIVDAYQYELQQEWVGVLLSPKLLERFPWIRECSLNRVSWSPEVVESLLPRFAWLQRVSEAEVPFANNAGKFNGYGVLPMPAQPEYVRARDLLHHISTLTNKFAELLHYAPDPRSQVKYGNSLLWLERHRSGWAKFSHGLAGDFPDFH